MPNFMFIGYTEEQYRDIKTLVDKTMKELNLDGEAVTTFFPGAIVESCDGIRKKMPYVRIFNSNPEQTKTLILPALAKNYFSEDIETSSGDFYTCDDIAALKEQ